MNDKTRMNALVSLHSDVTARWEGDLMVVKSRAMVTHQSGASRPGHVADVVRSYSELRALLGY